MARIDCKCDDCKSKFNLSYIFLKPEKIKCPACGSYRVKEEAVESRECGCSGNQDRPFRFT